MGTAPTGFPVATVQVAFPTAPGAVTPIWVDITDFVIAFSTQRGRSDELQQYDAGRLNLTLDNRLGSFDPTYTSSPYYPNVLPMRLVRVRAVWNSITYPIFLGFMDGWPQDWPTDRIQVTATDAFKPLSTSNYVNASQPQETIANRVGEILTTTTIGFSYNVSTTLVAADSIDSDALSLLQALSDTEGGQVYIDESGLLRFEDRHYRANNKLSITATFGDNDSTELPFETLEPIFDDTQVINDALIDAPNAVFPLASPAEYTDTTSQLAYGTRSISKSLLFADSNKAGDYAYAIVQRFKTPMLRFDSMTFLPFLQQANLWPQALGRVIGDLIEVKQRPPSGNVIDQQVHIDSIAHGWDSETFEWTTTWGLCPKAASSGGWLLDDAVRGLWGSTTVLSA